MLGSQGNACRVCQLGRLKLRIAPIGRAEISEGEEMMGVQTRCLLKVLLGSGKWSLPVESRERAARAFEEQLGDRNPLQAARKKVNAAKKVMIDGAGGGACRNRLAFGRLAQDDLAKVLEHRARL